MPLWNPSVIIEEKKWSYGDFPHGMPSAEPAKHAFSNSEL